MPRGGLAAGDLADLEVVAGLLEDRSGGGQFLGRTDHGQHDAHRTEGGGAQQGAQLHAEDGRVAQQQSDAAQAEEGVVLVLGRQAGDRLVAAAVEHAEGDRPAAGPFDDALVGLELALLVGKAALALKQELGADQTDAVAMGRDRRRRDRSRGRC